MKELDVSFNRIGDEGAQHLSTSISKTEKLVMWKCYITDKGVKTLAAAIKRLRKPVMFISEFAHFCSHNISCFLV